MLTRVAMLLVTVVACSDHSDNLGSSTKSDQTENSADAQEEDARAVTSKAIASVPDKFTLKITPIDDFIENASLADFRVKVHKNGKFDEKSERKITVTISCESFDDENYREKATASGKAVAGVATFSEANFNSITWEGGTYCLATASSEGVEAVKDNFIVRNEPTSDPRLKISDIANFDDTSDIADFTVKVYRNYQLVSDSTLGITVQISCDVGGRANIYSHTESASNGVATFTKDDFNITWKGGESCRAVARDGSEEFQDDFDAFVVNLSPANLAVDGNTVVSHKSFVVNNSGGHSGSVQLATSGCDHVRLFTVDSSGKPSEVLASPATVTGKGSAKFFALRSYQQREVSCELELSNSNDGVVISPKIAGDITILPSPPRFSTRGTGAQQRRIMHVELPADPNHGDEKLWVKSADNDWQEVDSLRWGESQSVIVDSSSAPARDHVLLHSNNHWSYRRGN